MNRTLLLLLLFLILAAGTFFYIKNSSPKSSLSTATKSDRDFAIDDREDIYKIFLAKRTGTTSLLERKGDDWIFNGKYKARPNAIAMMMGTFEGIRVKYLAPKAAHENMREDLATNGIKVELYNKANEKVKCYYVGGVNNDETGTFMIMEGANTPHLIHLPNWEGGLRVRYAMTGEDWRDKTVIGGEELEEIKSISVEYPLQKNKSFKINRSGKNYEVIPFHDDMPKTTRSLRKGAAESYFISYEKGFVAEAFDNRNNARDSITHNQSFCNVKLTTTDGKENTVRFFPKRYKVDYLNLEKVSEEQTKIERFHADCSNDDFMLIQTRVFKPIFRSYEHFFQ